MVEREKKKEKKSAVLLATFATAQDELSLIWGLAILPSHLYCKISGGSYSRKGYTIHPKNYPKPSFSEYVSSTTLGMNVQFFLISIIIII